MGYTYEDVVKAFWSKKNRKGGGWCHECNHSIRRYYYCDNGGGHYRDQVVVDASDVKYLFHDREIARLEDDNRLVIIGYPSITTRNRLNEILKNINYYVMYLSWGLVLHKWWWVYYNPIGYDITRNSITLQRNKNGDWDIISDKNKKILIGNWCINQGSNGVIAFRHKRRKYYYYKGMVFEPIHEGYRPYHYSKEIPMSNELKASVIEAILKN
jgi:hypothetical protein